MEITVSKRFLRVPVKFDGTSHKFTFSENGTPVYKFDAVYTEENADAVYYADLRDYLGKTMTVTVEPECAFTPVFEDAVTPLTAEEAVLRPQLHFTAERGWINDPNGLCFYGGQYHLFYQHNPYGRLWGNMHWGHAVSPDLLHWEYKEEAMFLDMDGAMFSGCAVVDHNNVSGLKEGDETPILFFYTCAGEKKSTQCLAYSTDGGKTLKKYDKNPLIDEIAPGNRDPKVIYDAKRARWLMALYFVERTYAIFTSQDLLHCRNLTCPVMTSARISIRLQQMTAERCGSIPVRTTCILSVILMKTAFTIRFSRSGSFRITRSRMRRRRITTSRASRSSALRGTAATSPARRSTAPCVRRPK